MAIAFSRLASLSTVLVAASCTPDPAPVPPTGSLHAAARARWPSARLPYRVRAGTTLQRGLSYVERPAGHVPVTLPVTSSLVSVVALPDERIAVVFAPDDRVGLDIAYAGLDLPWRRVHLSDWPLEQIGTLDAVGAPDGTVHVVVRRGIGTREIVHFAWREGAAPTQEPVPMPPDPQRFRTRDSCEDAVIEVSPAGAIDIAFRHQVDSSMVGFQQRLVFAHKPAGASAFALETVAETDRLGPIVALGCRLRLSYDDSEQPVVMALRERPQGGGLPTLKSPTSFIRGADGRFYNHGPQISLSIPGDEYTAQFDLARHPLGFVLAGPFFETRSVYLEPFVTRSMPYGAPGRQNATGAWGLGRDQGFVRSEYQGGDIRLDACGAASSRPRILNPTSQRGFPTITYGGGCPLSPRHAPVVAQNDVDEARALFGANYADAVFSRHDEPYGATLCLLEDRSMVVCEGGHLDFDPQKPVGAPTEIVASTLADGAVVEPGQPLTATFTLSRWAEGSFAYQPPVTELLGGGVLQQHVSYTQNPAARTVTLTIPGEFLRPGLGYQIAFPPLGGDREFVEPWTAPEARPAFVRFRVRGEVYSSPGFRERPMQVNCGRDAQGRCEPQMLGVSPYELRLDFDRPFALPEGATVVWRTADGSARYAAEATAGTNLLIRPTEAIPGETDYVVEIPALIDLQWGTRLRAEDREIRVRSPLARPAVVSSSPADGATGVARDAPFRIVFNTAVEADAVQYHAALVAQGATQGVSLMATQQDPRTVAITHPVLNPTTTYRLTLPTRLPNAEGVGPESDIVIAFTTAP